MKASHLFAAAAADNFNLAAIPRLAITFVLRKFALGEIFAGRTTFIV